MLRTCGIEFARRAFFVVAPIAKPTKTSPIQSRSEVASRRTMPKAVLGPDRRSNARATRTPGRATTRSIGSRRSGKASKRPMYSASRILDFNRSPHDLDERLFEARRFEGHLAFLAEPALDDREDLLGGLRLEDLGRGGAVPRRRLDDHAHPDAGVAFRLVDRPDEDCRSEERRV